MIDTNTIESSKLQYILDEYPATLTSLLPHAATQYGANIALIADNKEYSFIELDSMAARFANALQSRGVKSEDCVSLLASNSAAWFACYHGALRLGAVINPLNVMLTPEEIKYAVNNCGAKVLIANGDKLRLLESKGLLSGLHLVVSLDEKDPKNSISFEDLIADQSEQFKPVQIDPKALSTICYTSGTTGRPKGAMQSHESVIYNIIMTAYMHNRTADDVVVSALPCPHVYGNVVMNSALIKGMKLIMHRRFDEQEVLDSIEQHGATILEGVPAMYMLLLNHPKLKSTDLTSLRFCTVGGQTMPVAKMKDVITNFGCPLIELWGMTELAGLGTTFFANRENRLGSIGVPLPRVEARIVDIEDASISMQSGKSGELMIRGSIVMMGYFNNEEATRESIEADGWLHTGDIAYMDEEGFIFIVDRKKDMILTGGYNIYPAEVERAIYLHPAVAMVAVGSVPDEIKGEVPKAYVILKHDSVTSVDSIITHCREHLAAYKIPRQIRFVTDLPKTSTGKLMRRALRSLDEH